MDFTKVEQVCTRRTLPEELTRSCVTSLCEMREGILNDAIKAVCTDRNAQYGEPEDNFKIIAELWNNYLRYAKSSVTQLDAYDVGMLMTLLKIGRAMTGTLKMDTFIDAAGYIACAGEIAARTGGKDEKTTIRNTQMAD